MEIYRKNISAFLNFLFLFACFCIEPIYIMILTNFPFSFIIPFGFGAFMGTMDQYIDWTIK